MKKTAALLFALLCIAGLTSCQKSTKSLTTAEKLAKTTELMATVKSMDADLVTKVNISAADKTIANTITASIHLFTDPLRIKGTLNTQTDSSSQAVEFYVLSENNSLVEYFYSDGKWSKQTLKNGLSDSTVSQYNLQKNINLTLNNLSGTAEQGVEEINGKKAYKITGKITGEALQKEINSANLSGLSSMIDSASYAKIFENLPDVPVTIWVAQDDLYLIKYSMDITGCMNQMYKNMASLGSQYAILSSIAVNQMQVEMTCRNFNSAGNFELPSAASSASEITSSK